jgi:hypothetical protein
LLLNKTLKFICQRFHYTFSPFHKKRTVRLPSGCDPHGCVFSIAVSTSILKFWSMHSEMTFDGIWFLNIKINELTTGFLFHDCYILLDSTFWLLHSAKWLLDPSRWLLDSKKWLLVAPTWHHQNKTRRNRKKPSKNNLKTQKTQKKSRKIYKKPSKISTRFC